MVGTGDAIISNTVHLFCSSSILYGHTKAVVRNFIQIILEYNKIDIISIFSAFN